MRARNRIRALLVGAVALLALAGRAGAESVTVPDVVGKSRAQAAAALAASGLVAATIEVAGTPPDTVARQEPPAGNPAPPGSPVTIFVRRSVAVATTAPNAVGLLVADANAALGSVYLLRLEKTTGPEDQRGKVVAQSPASGASLEFRGELVLRFVPDEGLPARVVVPDLQGLSAADAQAEVAAAGLHARVARASVAGAPPDVVIGQRPSAGTEVERYWTVDVVVSTGEGGEAPPAAQVRIPNLYDLTEATARADLDGVGLAAEVEWIDGDASRAFLVDSQSPVAGALVDAGSTVRLRVVRYAPPSPSSPPPEEQVPVPNLIGRTQHQAEALLDFVGLIADPILLPNPSAPAFRVFGQQRVPGTLVPHGTVVTFRVAKPPPPPAPVGVPDFYLKTKPQAIAMAALAGLGIDVDHVLNPVKPENRVYAQSIAAGTVVPLGTTISVKVAKHPPGPATTTVPNLIGKTAAQATALLAGASLTGDKHEVSTNAKPPFKVYVQNPLAGANVPVGTTVHYTVAKPVLVMPVAVPNLIGLTKVQAHAAITGADLAPDVDVVVAPGKPPGKVYAQMPAAGAVVAKGTVVHANVASAALVSVPNLIGLTPGQANAALALKGLGSNGQIQLQLFKPPGKVYSQNKVAGSMVAPGTVVKWKANP